MLLAHFNTKKVKRVSTKIMEHKERIMISRQYLPFKSARQYVDRGMAKWAGFFISEHSTALAKPDDSIDYSIAMSTEEILLLITQAYINKLEVKLFTNLQRAPFLGFVIEITDDSFYFKSTDKVILLNIEKILCLELL